MKREELDAILSEMYEGINSYSYAKMAHQQILAEYDRLHTVYEAAMAYVRINPVQCWSGSGWEEYFELKTVCEKAEETE